MIGEQKIGDRFNYDDVFFRDLTVCVLDTMEGRIKWVNKFSSGDVPVDVPFYYSVTGDERFLLDSFQDDIVSNNRYIELNTDIIPRGHLTLTNWSIKSDEFEFILVRGSPDRSEFFVGNLWHSPEVIGSVPVSISGLVLWN